MGSWSRTLASRTLCRPSRRRPPASAVRCCNCVGSRSASTVVRTVMMSNGHPASVTSYLIHAHVLYTCCQELQISVNILYIQVYV